MKKLKKYAVLSLAVLTLVCFTACGTKDKKNDTNDMAGNKTNTESQAPADEAGTNDNTGNTSNTANNTENGADSAGKDNITEPAATENGTVENTENTTNANTDAADGDGMLEDAGHAVGDAVDDLADGVKNVSDDVTGR